MNIRSALFLFLTLVVTVNLSAQREAANWYFGRNAGIQFTGNGVVPLLNGSLNTNEGCATISDKFGNLLFYTDGSTVWDRTNSVMPNGFGLLGDASSTQSAIIVPQPENSDIYYIFTVNALSGDVHNTNLLQGLNYYIVDMSVGPNGTVIGRGNNNSPLLIPNSEKITAVRSADCSSIWVISQLTDAFYAFEVTNTGVNPVPVFSQVPTDVPLGGYRYNAIGYLKASPDGTKLAIAHSTVSNVTDRSAPGKLLIYDFDTATGLVTNEQELDVSNRSPYGVEFSPNSELLYATTDFYDSEGNYINGQLFQYNLTVADINASRIRLGEFVNGALQLAPDGKIYNSQFGSGALNVINQPNEPGIASNFVPGQQTLGGRTATFGLPPFIQSLFNEVVNIIGANGGNNDTDLVLCLNDTFTFTAPLVAGASYTWTFEDPNNNITTLPSSGNTYTLNNATVANEGIYKLEIDRNDGSCPVEGFAFVTIAPLPAANNTTLIQCDIDEDSATDGLTSFNLIEASDELRANITTNGIVFYETLTDLQNGNAITNPENFRNTIAFNQTIYAEITGQNGCNQVAELELIVQPTIITPSAVPAYYNCDITDADTPIDAVFDLETIRNAYAPLEANFYSNRTDASLEVSPLSGNFRTTSTELLVRLELNGQCQGVEVIELNVDPLPQVNYPDEIFICLNDLPEIITAESGFDNYQWFQLNGNSETEISNTQSASITQPGNYRLQLTRNYNDGGVARNCSSSKNFQVLASNIATITNIEINDFRDNNTVIVEVTGEGDYEYALNNINGPYQDSNILNNLPPGEATIYVRDKNNCGIVSRDIFILGFPKFFTPNGDGFNDVWKIIGVRSDFISNAKIYIFDRYGKTLKELRLNGTGWDGTFNGRPMPSSDYWFRIILDDGRQIRGHFALKR